jgi:hypothetical protein
MFAASEANVLPGTIPCQHGGEQGFPSNHPSNNWESLDGASDGVSIMHPTIKITEAKNAPPKIRIRMI